jgi:hypothetical protein
MKPVLVSLFNSRMHANEPAPPMFAVLKLDNPVWTNADYRCADRFTPAFPKRLILQFQGSD